MGAHKSSLPKQDKIYLNGIIYSVEQDLIEGGEKYSSFPVSSPLPVLFCSSCRHEGCLQKLQSSPLRIKRDEVPELYNVTAMRRMMNKKHDH